MTTPLPFSPYQAPPCTCFDLPQLMRKINPRDTRKRPPHLWAKALRRPSRPPQGLLASKRGPASPNPSPFFPWWVGSSSTNWSAESPSPNPTLPPLMSSTRCWYFSPKLRGSESVERGNSTDGWPILRRDELLGCRAVAPKAWWGAGGRGGEGAEGGGRWLVNASNQATPSPCEEGAHACEKKIIYVYKIFLRLWSILYYIWLFLPGIKMAD